MKINYKKKAIKKALFKAVEEDNDDNVIFWLNLAFGINF
jgi:hypothetical protein